ncbi:unnamed protein product, partial [Leptidea sinapis]
KLTNYHRDILVKYESGNSCEDSCGLSDESNFNDSPLGSTLYSPNSEEDNNAAIKMLRNYENNFIKSDETVSEDTGRASSLALSDTDKTYDSPEDFSKTPFENRIYVETATSPIRIEDEGITSENTLEDEIVTNPQLFEDDFMPASPNIFDDEALLSDNPIAQKDSTSKSPQYFIMDIPLTSEVITIKEKIQLADACTSPIHLERDVVHEATSPIIFEPDVEILADDAHKPNNSTALMEPSIVNLLNVTETHHKHSVNNVELEISQDAIKKNVCFLETTNNKISSEEINNDNEVATILNNMRMQHELMSPLPQTSPTIKISRKNISNSTVQKPHISDSNMTSLDALNIMANSENFNGQLLTYLNKEFSSIKHVISCLTKGIEQLSQLNTNVQLDNSTPHKSVFDDDTNDSLCDHNDLIEQDPVILNVEQLSENTTNNSSNIITEAESRVLNGETDNLTKHSYAIKRKSQHVSKHGKPNRNILLKHKKGKIIKQRNKKSNVLQSGKRNIRNKSLPKKIITDINNTNNFNNLELIQNHIQGDKELFCFENDEEIGSVNNINENVGGSPDKERRRAKTRKLSKLDKFRKKLYPIVKYTRSITPPRLRTSRKKLHKVRIVKRGPMKPADILNNKEAYEKAAKVMAQIRMKEKSNLQTHKTIDETSKDKDNVEEIGLAEKFDKTVSNCRDNLKKPNTNSPKKRNTNSPNLMKSCKNVTRSRRSLIELQKLGPISNLVDDLMVTEEVNADISCDNTNRFKQKQTCLKRALLDSDAPISCKRLLRSTSKTLKEIDDATNSKVIEKENLNIKQSKRKDSSIDSIIAEMDTNDSKTQQDEKYKSRNFHHPSDSKRKQSLQKDAHRTKSCHNEANQKSEEKLKRESFQEKEIVSYNDIDMFSTESELDHVSCNDKMDNTDLINHETPKKLENHTESRRILRSSISSNQGTNKTDTTIITRATDQNVNEEKIKCFHKPSNARESRNSENNDIDGNIINFEKSVLCKMIEKYARNVIKYAPRKISDKVMKPLYDKFDKVLLEIVELTPKKAIAWVKKFAADIVEHWTKKQFLIVLMNYLQNPSRKLELFSKVNFNPGPPMTKQEYYILILLNEINSIRPNYNIVSNVLNNIEFTLFQLNKSPVFDTIETLSHFYAVICRYHILKRQLRTFLLDAMYCLQFKAIPLIKQCLSVWNQILPLAHMNYAKSPLITCIVYLLHFYKCKDPFNRVSEIRYLLQKKHFFTITDWNEAKILDMFSNAITEVK